MALNDRIIKNQSDRIHDVEDNTLRHLSPSMCTPEANESFFAMQATRRQEAPRCLVSSDGSDIELVDRSASRPRSLTRNETAEPNRDHNRMIVNNRFDGGV